MNSKSILKFHENRKPWTTEVHNDVEKCGIEEEKSSEQKYWAPKYLTEEKWKTMGLFSEGE